MFSIINKFKSKIIKIFICNCSHNNYKIEIDNISNVMDNLCIKNKNKNTKQYTEYFKFCKLKLSKTQYNNFNLRIRNICYKYDHILKNITYNNRSYDFYIIIILYIIILQIGTNK